MQARGGRVTARCVTPLALALWELPQNVLGAGLLAAHRALRGAKSETRERQRLFIESKWVAVSLGYFVFWMEPKASRHFFLDEATRDHEFGHTLQSRMLGPLYLALIGVPSVSRVAYAIAYRELTGKRWRHYFDGWPEKQADRYGSVDPPRIRRSWPKD